MSRIRIAYTAWAPKIRISSFAVYDPEVDHPQDAVARAIARRLNLRADTPSRDYSDGGRPVYRALFLDRYNEGRSINFRLEEDKDADAAA